MTGDLIALGVGRPSSVGALLLVGLFGSVVAETLVSVVDLEASAITSLSFSASSLAAVNETASYVPSLNKSASYDRMVN